VFDMPQYKTTGFLIHNGEVLDIGSDIELTEEQAERLNAEQENVVLTEEGKLEEKTVEDLQAEAKDLGIKGYSKMNKDDLKAAIIEATKE
jgi:hypothetical protein